MATLCIIGSSGHWRYVLEGLMARGMRDPLLGVAAGSVGEDLRPLLGAFHEKGITLAPWQDWRAMLDALNPEVVVINSHFGDHAHITLECLQRGLHVFSEKPIATTLTDLDLLRSTHAQGHSLLSAMFGIRFKPWFLTARRLVAEGRIGRIRLMQAQKSYRLGRRPPFFHSREQHGGLIPWVGSHAIDWLRWFSGEHFESVFALHSRQSNQAHGELEVSAQCQFRMSGEVCAQVSLDYLRPAQAPTHDDDRIRVVGTQGAIEVRDSQVWLIDDGAGSPQPLHLDAERWIFAEFLAETEGGTPCMTGAEDAFEITRACLLARQSADAGCLVTF
jgi:predicted dehydrogenase